MFSKQLPLYLPREELATIIMSGGVEVSLADWNGVYKMVTLQNKAGLKVRKVLTYLLYIVIIIKKNYYYIIINIIIIINKKNYWEFLQLGK